MKNSKLVLFIFLTTLASNSNAIALCDLYPGFNGTYCLSSRRVNVDGEIFQQPIIKYITRNGNRLRKRTVQILHNGYAMPYYVQVGLLTPGETDHEVVGILYKFCDDFCNNPIQNDRFIGLVKLDRGQARVVKFPFEITGLIKNSIITIDSQNQQYDIVLQIVYKDISVPEQYFVRFTAGRGLDMRLVSIQGPFLYQYDELENNQIAPIPAKQEFGVGGEN